ncbi:hypothetical protein GCM10007426_11330 [Alloalcanivorax dieselolei]|nr:hypothetical protein GCM10007426_11330 [Alloalcanivorax dieselolei]
MSSRRVGEVAIVSQGWQAPWWYYTILNHNKRGLAMKCCEQCTYQHYPRRTPYGMAVRCGHPDNLEEGVPLIVLDSDKVELRCGFRQDVSSAIQPHNAAHHDRKR